MNLKTLTKLATLTLCMMLIKVKTLHANTSVTLKYQNQGVNFYTTEQLYSDKWAETLDYALAQYQSLLYKPKKIDVYLVKSKTQASELRQQKQISQNQQLVLSLESIASKKHQYNTEFSTISHELCHLWLISSVEEKGLLQQKDPMGIPAYGHANVNDWIDESVATQCEFGEIAASRTSEVFNLVPLKEFLNQENPVFSAMKHQILAALKSSQGQQVVISQEVDDSASIVFYQQSTWFRHYLRYRLGDNIYRDLVQKIVQQQDVLRYLLKALGYSNWQEVDADFAAFINARNQK